ncbi:MAG: hypothetical protein KDA27_26395 [Candidatus Eisenbacteria bacterium]|uniref:Uncharacterized protein n=1 Tax=Eiseniibacteriota bacterium TaxID=2212470 RepID=A0A956SGJ7_UNCEI|nr:hypothetical protein [Candidatus Eisenbacteria bacterium]
MSFVPLLSTDPVSNRFANRISAWSTNRASSWSGNRVSTWSTNRASTWAWLALSILSLCIQGCGSSPEPDPDQPFYMEMNGKPLTVTMKPGSVYVDSRESDWGVYRSFGVRFATGTRMATLWPGLDINFDPDAIEEGDVLEFDEEFGNVIRVTYRPDRGHRMSEAQILTFSPSNGGGGLVEFDVFDPSPNGRVAGRLVEATLHGYFEDVQMGEWVDPDEPMELILRNWAFDCTVPDYN